MRKLSFIALVIFSSVLYANPANDLKKLIEPIDTLKAHFVQKVYNKNQQVIQSASGAMEFKKPNLFRWLIVEPDPNLVVTDGTTLWNYDEMLAQVTVEKFDSAKEVSPVSFLFEDPEKHFQVEDISSSSFRLTPKDSNQSFKYLELFFKRGKITQLHMHDNLDQITVFDFMQVEKNTPIETSRFTFVAPAGVDVIGDK